MTTTGYDDRMLLIEVTGLRQQGVMPTSNYTFKVPYRSLTRTLQFISRQGGQVVRIESLSASLPMPALLSSAVVQDTIAGQPLSPLTSNVEAVPPIVKAPVDDASMQWVVPTAPVVTTPLEASPTPTDSKEEANPESAKPPNRISLFWAKLRSLGRVQSES
jgi:hypothetical protein